MVRFNGTKEQFKQFENKSVILLHSLTGTVLEIDEFAYEIYYEIGKNKKDYNNWYLQRRDYAAKS